MEVSRIWAERLTKRTKFWFGRSHDAITKRDRYFVDVTEDGARKQAERGCDELEETRLSMSNPYIGRVIRVRR